MLRLLSMTLSLIALVLVNGVANIMSLNGKTTMEILNRLPVLFTPASYVFSIWVIIYGLLAMWIYGAWRNQSKNDLSLLKLRSLLFNVSVVLHISWTFLWHYGFFNWTIVAMLALLATLTGLYFTYPKNENQFLQRVPIAIYLGWIIVIVFVNTNYLLTLREWSGWGLSAALWAVIYLTLATAIALHFMYHHRDLALNSVLMWAFIGIAVKNGFDTLFVSSAALFLTAVIGAGFFLTNNKPTEKSPLPK